MHEGREPGRPGTLVVALALTGLSGVANILVGAVVLTLLDTGALPARGGTSSPAGCGTGRRTTVR